MFRAQLGPGEGGGCGAAFRCVRGRDGCAGVRGAGGVLGGGNHGGAVRCGGRRAGGGACGTGDGVEDLFGPGEVPADMAAVGATCQAYLAGLDALGVVGHALFWRYVQSLLVEGAAGRALEAIGRALGQVDNMDVEGTAKTVEGAKLGRRRRGAMSGGGSCP